MPNEPKTDSPYLTPKEAGKRLGVSRFIVAKLYERRQLAGFNVEGTIRLYADSVEHYRLRHSNCYAGYVPPPRCWVRPQDALEARSAAGGQGEAAAALDANGDSMAGIALRLGLPLPALAEFLRLLAALVEQGGAVTATE